MTISSKRTRGFTIIESLVAIGIMVAIIIGAMSAVQHGLSSYLFSKDEITAFYMAQEAFEKVRNMRDENGIKSRNWLFGLAQTASDPCAFGKACMVSPAESAGATLCGSPGSCPPLREDTTTGFYGYNAAWPVSPFTREITFSPVSSTEVAVTVTVTWSKGGSTRSFKARENLLDWRSL